MPRCRPASLAAPTALALLLGAPAARAQTVVNIDAALYGFDYPSSQSQPPLAPGVVINPVSLAAGGRPDQLTLGPGTYQITNAAARGLAGAAPTFTAWGYPFDVSGNRYYLWSFLLADDATDRVVYYGTAGTHWYNQQAVASEAAVAYYVGTFTLAATTTLDFMAPTGLYPANVGQDDGGVSLAITPVGPATTAPEPATWALVGAGGLGVAGLARRRQAGAGRAAADA